MGLDKNYCMSSYLAFRYIVREDADFGPDLHHTHFVQMEDDRKIPVRTAEEIDRAIRTQFDGLKGKKLGILLSGGMDSAILAAYMPGCDAYTFRFLNGEYQKEEPLQMVKMVLECQKLKVNYRYGL